MQKFSLQLNNQLQSNYSPNANQPLRQKEDILSHEDTFSNKPGSQ